MKIMKLSLFWTLGIVVTFFVMVSGSATSVFAAGVEYPNKTMRLIVPFPPGGSVDIVGRLIATKLSESLGKQMIVDNRAGASGIIGTEMVAKSDPDGYTLVVATGVQTMLPALQKMPYDVVKSFTPVSKLASGPNSLVINPSVAAKSVKELIALAKQKPGQLIVGATGVGGVSHLAAELFKMMARIDYKIVQFKGGSPAMVDLLGGHSHVYFGTLIHTLPYIKSGEFKVLGTGGVKRSVILPDVPTIEEAGLPGFESTQWWGILAPAGTPGRIVDRLNNELKRILTSDEVKKRLLNEGAEVDYQNSAEFGKFLGREITRWKHVVKEANIKLEQ